jgi:hypothetical protein
MMDYIEQLKQRPISYRKRFTLGVSTGVTMAVFVVWASVIIPSERSVIIADSTPKAKVENNVETPINVIANGVADAYEAMKVGLQKLSGDSNDLQTEYNRMKGQVQGGEIQVIPYGGNRAE